MMLNNSSLNPNINITRDSAGNIYMSANSSSAGTITTTSPYISNGNIFQTMPYISSNVYRDDWYPVSLFTYLKEDEISEIIDRISERGMPESDLKSILYSIITTIHVSEQFIIKYYQKELIDKTLVKAKYKRELCAEEYAELAVLLELDGK